MDVNQNLGLALIVFCPDEFAEWARVHNSRQLLENLRLDLQPEFTAAEFPRQNGALVIGAFDFYAGVLHRACWVESNASISRLQWLMERIRQLCVTNHNKQIVWLSFDEVTKGL